MKNLVIVESPAKAKTIEKFLGKDYTVKSSYGHIRDLAKKEMSIDIDHNYEPQYFISDDKKTLVSELKKDVSKAEKVWLASDEDREGEAIAWHLQETLQLDPSTTQRIVFNEITPEAILHAIDNPRSIDLNIVNAQQARRVLDRLVGYEISPILWSKIKPGLSAGRVQSVAVRIVVEREKEILAFKSKASFRVRATFLSPQGQQLSTELSREFDTEEQANDFLSQLVGATFSVASIETHPTRHTPAPPFTTSTLQQEASRKLGFDVSRTMSVAQHLYEEGYITYMRTDSVNLSDFALNTARDTITKLYGAEYAKTRRYQTKTKGAQEAHEAIRPTHIENTTIDAEPSMRRLYELVWRRTMASQMADTQAEKTTIVISSPAFSEHFSTTGTRIIFDGFMKLYNEGTDDDNVDENSESLILPSVNKGESLTLDGATATQRFSHHPSRYTEASLVKKLEELGIGRPATYASTLSTIVNHEYVSKEDREATLRDVITLSLNNNVVERQITQERTGAEKGKLCPTDIGNLVVDFLMDHFNDIMDYNFTANVEKDLDEIAEGQQDWRSIIDSFYNPFHKSIEYTRTNSHKTNGERLLGIDPVRQKKVFAKVGRYGAMIQIGENTDEEKPVFASLMKGQSIQTITLEEALELFKLPRLVGTYEDADLKVSVGRFGPYIQHNKLFYSVPKTEDLMTITVERCIEIIERKRQLDAEKAEHAKLFPRLVGTYEGEEVKVDSGRYGPYLTYKGANYKLGRDTDLMAITIEEAAEVIKASPDKKPSRRAAGKTAKASETSAKTTAKSSAKGKKSASK